MPAKFGYWCVKARGQICRLLLDYGGEEYHDEVYTFNDYTRWIEKEKFSMGLGFPNLPYYIDGDLKMTESMAITRHLARKYNLYGSTQNEAALIDMIVDVATNFKDSNIKLVWDMDFQNKWQDFVKDLDKKYKAFEEFLGDNEWFVGNKISLADFAVFDALEYSLQMSSTSMDNFPKLKAHRKRFEALPNIAKYLSSPKNAFTCYARRAQENLESVRK